MDRLTALKGRFHIGFVGVLVLLCFGATLGASNLDIEYLEGVLEYQEGRNTWITAGIGDVIPEGRKVRLSGQGYAELLDGARTITLTRDGVYETADLSGDNSGKVSFREILGAKFSALFNRSDSVSSTVAAVRGSAIDGSDFITWEDEDIDYLADGVALYEEGNFIGAREYFDQGAIWATGETRRECIFRLGLTQQALGKPRLARETLIKLTPEAGDSYLGEYTLVTATLYLESMEYAKADAILSSYLKSNPQGDTSQAAWLLSSYSLGEQGDRAGQLTSLRKTLEMDANTEVGQIAASLLE